MNLDQVLGIVRALLTACGGLLLAKGVVTADVWTATSGFVVSLLSAGWSWRSHALVVDQVLGVVRAGIGAIGGYAVMRGWVSADQVAQWGGLAAVVVPMLWSIAVHADPGKPTVTPPGATALMLVAFLPLASFLAGCTAGATVNAAVADVTAIAAKIDAAVSVAIVRGTAAAKSAYAFTVAELPAVCSLSRSAANAIDSANSFGAFNKLTADDQVIVAQAKAALNAAGTSSGCQQIASGVSPANPAETATVIVAAFASARTALRNTKLPITATAVAGS